MTSEQLRQFKAVAEYRNITKAAEKLYITQPALSMALSKLEEEVARPLFVREGRRLAITKDGEVLLHYANTVCEAIDRAQDYFRVQEYSKLIKIYRIGGTAINLLAEGCYHLEGYRINCVLSRNCDLPSIVGSGMADIVIADDRYMHLATHEYVEKIFLYHQALMLSVSKKDPLSKLDILDIKDLHRQSMVGRSNPMGFNDWLNDVQEENHVDFNDVISINNMTYFAEREKLPWPYLMGSFGIGTAKEYFSRRKNIRVMGRYTERDIYCWYNTRNRKNIEPILQKIVENAKCITELDNKI